MRWKVRPPVLPGEVEERARAHKQSQEDAEARRERDAIAAQPGGVASLRASMFLSRERQVLARALVATNEGERQSLLANAADLRRFADEQIKEAQHTAMTTTAKEIRRRMQQRLGAVAQKMALIPAKEDEQFPPEFQVKRQEQRAELIREWTQIESQEHAAINAWADEERARADALYYADPVLDAAHESRRTADALEITGLAQQYVGRTTQARNLLLPQARQAIARGDLSRAHVVIEAAKRVGVIDDRLEQALTAAEDVTIPARREALAMVETVQVERDLFDYARYSQRIAHGVGNEVRNSTAIKMQAARQGVPTVAGIVTAAPEAPGEADA